MAHPRPTKKRTLSTRERRAHGDGRYGVAIIGDKPPGFEEESGHDEKRVRALQTRRNVSLWLESDLKGGLNVKHREGSTLTSRDPLRRQSAAAMESLFRNPVQRLAQLFPGGDEQSRIKAFERLRKKIASPGPGGEWDLLRRGPQDGEETVWFQAPERKLCVLVAREPHAGLPAIRAPGSKSPRIEARQARYDEFFKLFYVQLRGICPGRSLIDSLDLTAVVDGVALRLYDSSMGERGEAAQMRVKPKSAGPWLTFCFAGPYLRRWRNDDETRNGIVTLTNLVGPPLQVAVEVSRMTYHREHPLYGRTPPDHPLDRPDLAPQPGATSSGTTSERQHNDR